MSVESIGLEIYNPSELPCKRICRDWVFIPGKVQPQERTRAGISQTSGKAFVYEPGAGKTAQYKTEVKTWGMQFRMKHRDIEWPHDGPVIISAYMLRPKTKAWFPDLIPYSGGDLDNLLKLAQDALQGILWTNDNRVVDYGFVRKRYANIEGVLYIFEFYKTPQKPKRPARIS